ncbi:MAG: adenine deaminase [Kiritimatiellae bacterium]|nr:adenine deaminase [Kiritimatiellia bacterium]
MNYERWLAVARGDQPADVALRGGRVVDVATGEVRDADVAWVDGLIAGVGSGLDAREIVRVTDCLIAPGLVDAHVHIESSLATPAGYAETVSPHGTTTVIADPHEIANVAGADGVSYMLACGDDLPVSIRCMLPACVPATALATSGATLTAGALLALADQPGVCGLGEFMNVPGTVAGDPDCLAKLKAFRAAVVDGHAPALQGRALQAYTGAGPRSDHECTTPAEVVEKLRAGMHIWLREGTAARNLLALLPAITPATSHRCGFCTDDLHPAELLDAGHMDHLVRLAIGSGLPWMTALQMATLNPCQFYGLRDRGLVAPGRRADLIVFGEPTDFRVSQVWQHGRLVARDGVYTGPRIPARPLPAALRGAVRVSLPDESRFRVAAGDGATLLAIGLVPGQLLTRAVRLPARVVNGSAEADPARDLAKLAVFERHTGSGRAGLGFVQGLGLRRGALAGTIAHDAHNLVVAGMDDASMLTAARAVMADGGGLAAASGDAVLARLPLPVGGLMSDAPMTAIRGSMDALCAAAVRLGACENPWMPLSFLSLEVIPELRLTDRGLVDVTRFALVPGVATT